MVMGDQSKPDDAADERLSRVHFSNNLYLKLGNWPPDLLIQDNAPLFGDPEFAGGGGLSPSDYLPKNQKLISDKGIMIDYLTTDDLRVMQCLYLTDAILATGIEIGLEQV